MQTIVLFKTDLPTVDLFSRELAEGFKEEGYDIFWFDITDSINAMSSLYQYMESHTIAAMVGFNSNVFGIKTPSGASVWETLGIPTINILVDNPFWYHKILSSAPANGAILCIDRNHMNFVQRFYPHIGITGFLPHGGTFYKPGESNASVGNTDKPYKPIKDRSIPVIYTGSFYADYANTQKPDFSNVGFDAEKINKDVIDYLIANPDKTIEEVIEEQLHSNNINLSEDQLLLYISANSYIERIVSSFYREKTLKSVAESGAPLVIYGRGWESCEWIKRDNVDYRGMVSPEKVLEEIADSKILLNSMPWFKDGSHERIFNAMLMRSVLATETNPYIYETLPEQSYISFSLSNLDKLGNDIIEALKDEDKLQSIADTAYGFASKGQTWADRAKEICHDLMSNIK